MIFVYDNQSQFENDQHAHEYIPDIKPITSFQNIDQNIQKKSHTMQPSTSNGQRRL